MVGPKIRLHDLRGIGIQKDYQGVIRKHGSPLRGKQCKILPPCARWVKAAWICRKCRDYHYFEYRTSDGNSEYPGRAGDDPNVSTCKITVIAIIGTIRLTHIYKDSYTSTIAIRDTRIT